MNNPVGWFEIYVEDMERAINFYQTVLNITLEKLEAPDGSDTEMQAFPSSFEHYGATGALVKMSGIDAGGNSTMVFFSCDNCANEEARVADAGGSVERAKFSIGEHGFCSIAVDSEGNRFGLHSNQ